MSSSVTAYLSSWWYGNANANAAPAAAASDTNKSTGSATVGSKDEFSEKEIEDFMVVDRVTTDAKATAKANDILKPRDNIKESEDLKAKSSTNVVAVAADVVVRRTYYKAPSKKSRDRQLAKALFADADTEAAKPSIPRSYRSQLATTRQHGHNKSPYMPIQQPSTRKLVNG